MRVLHEEYALLIDAVTAGGKLVESRYGPTREMIAWSISYQAGEMISRRGANHAIGMMELMQFLGGIFDRDAIQRVAPGADIDLFTPKMAYGPRIRRGEQVSSVICALQEDPLTRQAIIFIGSPEDGPTSDQPCTTTMQFLLRNGVLNGVVSMRSWDLVKGMTYDVVLQGGLLMAIARCLDVAAGEITTTAGSMHVYEADFDKKPDGKSLRFEMLPWFPAVWPAIASFCRGQVEIMERVPDGIRIIEGK